MMDIDKAFEQFIEFPEGSSGNLVTTVSAKLFAKYCVEKLQQQNDYMSALASGQPLYDMEEKIADLMQRNKALKGEAERLRKHNDELQLYNVGLAESELKLQQERDQLKKEIAHLQIEVNNLRGLKPEIPPLPGEDWPRELPRYILRENGPHRPRSVPHKDGYWTPWYLANRLHEELERERKAAKTACANWGEMKQERDQLAVEVEALTPYRDNHHDLIRHMADHDTEVIERAINECAHKTLEGEVIYVECIREYANQLRQQAKEVKS
jgi:small-conductance mechanosensitive channel